MNWLQTHPAISQRTGVREKLVQYQCGEYTLYGVEWLEGVLTPNIMHIPHTVQKVLEFVIGGLYLVTSRKTWDYQDQA